VRRFVGGLRKLGFGKGDRVGLLKRHHQARRKTDRSS
jgi:hypothetical protein